MFVIELRFRRFGKIISQYIVYKNTIEQMKKYANCGKFERIFLSLEGMKHIRDVAPNWIYGDELVFCMVIGKFRYSRGCLL